MTNFIIYALPRSRTFWLSRFLSHGATKCGHDELRHVRGLDDIQSLLSMPNYGSVETAAAPWWRLLHAMSPGLRTVIVRRPVSEVVESLIATGTPFDRDHITAAMQRLDAKLDQIKARVPGALEVQFSDLSRWETCAKVFEHCTGQRLERSWFDLAQPLRLVIDFEAMVRHFKAHRPQLERVAHQAKRSILAGFGPRKTISRDDITIQQETCGAWLRDGKRLFEEHSIQLGEAPDGYLKRNWELMETMDRIGSMQVMTARCNGRMVGYYVCYIAPATDDASVMSSLQISVFVSKDFSGLATKLQRASIDALRKKGVGEVFFRAGIKADGARMGILYQRAGAECIGQMYRLPLKGS